MTVNGQFVMALLDSGSFMSLVRQDLVPVSNLDYSKQENVLCVHGDNHPGPTVDVAVNIDEQTYLSTPGVVEKLPVPVLFAWSSPIPLDLLLKTTSAETNSGEKVEVKINVVL